jgi:hypothetical protein
MEMPTVPKILLSTVQSKYIPIWFVLLIQGGFEFVDHSKNCKNGLEILQQIVFFMEFYKKKLNIAKEFSKVQI